MSGVLGFENTGGLTEWVQSQSVYIYSTQCLIERSGVLREL